MKKRLLFIGLIIVSLFIFSACGKETDAKKFKNEYESLNGTTSKSGKQIRELSIDKENPMVYKTADEIVKMIENKETFVVYFGFASCPWCRSVLPSLLKASKDLGLDTIYYVDVLEIRDTLEINDEGQIVIKTRGTDAYYQLLDLLDEVLDKYSMKDANGKDVDTKEKRIYAPNVVAIINGKADKMTTGISDAQTDGYMELTEDMINETYDRFKCLINCVLDSKGAACPVNQAC